MSWSWSHMAYGQMNAMENLALRPLAKLQEIWAEWLAYDAGVVKEKQQIVDDLLDAEDKELLALADALDREEITPAEYDLQCESTREQTITDTKRALKNYHPSSSMDAFDSDTYRKELKRIRKEHRSHMETAKVSAAYGGWFSGDLVMQGRAAKRAMENGLRAQLAESIWPRMEELATCTNGGWKAYCCPYGCGPHMVSFSSTDELREAGLEKARAKKKIKSKC